MKISKTLSQFALRALYSFVPFFLVSSLLFYFLFNSYVYALFFGLMIIIVVFIFKRYVTIKRQKRTIQSLLDVCSTEDDRTHIALQDNDEWSCGILFYDNVTFVCMLSFTVKEITLKLPTSMPRKKLFYPTVKF